MTLKFRASQVFENISLWIVLFSLSGIGLWPHAVTGEIQGKEFINSALSYVATTISLIYILYGFKYQITNIIPTGSKALLIFIIYIIIGATWSKDPASSIISSTRLVTYTIFIMIQVRRNSGFFRSVILYCALFAFLNLAAVVLAPSHATEQGWLSRAGDWRGLLVYRIALGATSAGLLLAVLHDSFTRHPRLNRWIALGTICALAALVYGSQARLAWASLIIGAPLLVLMHAVQRMPARHRVSWGALGLIGAILIPVSLSSALPVVAEAWGRDLTFSGRSQLWPLFIQRAMLEPVTGHGTGVFFSDPVGREVLWREARWAGFSTAHNSYIEWFLNLGIPGLILFSVVMAIYYVKVCSAALLSDLEYAPLLVALCPVITTQTLFMSEAAFPSPTWIIITLTLAAPMTRRLHRRPTRPLPKLRPCTAAPVS